MFTNELIRKVQYDMLTLLNHVNNQKNLHSICINPTKEQHQSKKWEKISSHLFFLRYLLILRMSFFYFSTI